MPRPIGADLRLDLIAFGDPPERFLGDRRAGGDVDRIELATRVDHPNTIDDLRFVLALPFAAPVASRRRGRLAS